MAAVESSHAQRLPAAREDAPARLSARSTTLALAGLAAIAVLLHLATLTTIKAPTVFSDELGYEALARSIGLTGHLGLFDHRGLSYSPLYPALLAPIFAAGASAPTAYALIKVVNAVLLALSIFPTYAIARFVLPRGQALIVAALGAAAPLMFYSSFSASENLAYPLCLVAIWAMLAALHAPSWRSDVALLAACVLASLARVQLLVLFPAALTAVLVLAAFRRDGSWRRRLARGVREHPLLFGPVALALVVAGLAAAGGAGVYALLGRYANVGREGLPAPAHFLDLLVRHLAGLDLAVGVVPFVAAIVAAGAFARRGLPARVAPFAAVAVSVTTWLLVQVAYDAAVFDGHGDLPRIHERFLIYTAPFFLVALLATVRIPEAFASRRLYLAAAVTAALLPAVIPFHTVVNQTITFDTLALLPFSHPRGGVLVAVPHAAVAAVASGAVLGALFVHVRRQTRALVLLLLIPFLLIAAFVVDRQQGVSRFARTLLPARTNWVDATSPHSSVTLLTARTDQTAGLETAYANLSIGSLYYLCHPAAGPEFGEQRATIDGAGRLRDSSGEIRASYVVAPTTLDVRGEIVARNRPGHEVLVRLPDRRISVDRNGARCA